MFRSSPGNSQHSGSVSTISYHLHNVKYKKKYVKIISINENLYLPGLCDEHQLGLAPLLLHA